MNDIYEYKARKYKHKYLKLKKQYIGEGGANDIENFFSNLFPNQNTKAIFESQKKLYNDNIANNKNSIKKLFNSFLNSSNDIISIINLKNKNNNKFIIQYNDDTDVSKIIKIINDLYDRLINFLSLIQDYNIKLSTFKDEIEKNNIKLTELYARNKTLEGGDITSDVTNFLKSSGDFITSIFLNPNPNPNPNPENKDTDYKYTDYKFMKQYKYNNNIDAILDMISFQKNKINFFKYSIEDLYHPFISDSSKIINFIFYTSFTNQLDNNNTEVIKIINDHYNKITELKNLIQNYNINFLKLKDSIEKHYTELTKIYNLKKELYYRHDQLITDIKTYKIENIDLINNILNEKKNLLFYIYNKVKNNDYKKKKIHDRFQNYIEFNKLINEIIITLEEQINKLIKEEHNYLNSINYKILNLDKLLQDQQTNITTINKEKIKFKNILTKRIEVINNAKKEKLFLEELKSNKKNINDIDEQILNTIDKTYLEELLKYINDKNDKENELIKKIESKIMFIDIYNTIINNYYENNIKKLELYLKHIISIIQIQNDNKYGKIRDIKELEELKQKLITKIRKLKYTVQ